MSLALRRQPSTADVVAGLARQDTRSLARALTWVEDDDERGVAVLRATFASTGRARRLGITGSPGAGKSTLVDRLAVELCRKGRRVAIVAVDPSSAFSGGALLGDRVRMQEASSLPGLFIRSMATRGHLGGLARATEDAVDLLDAFGFDDVLVETVGVGQDEIEVVQLAHVNLVVLVPFMGDDVQALKAGIMEIADAFVVNKADREGADRMEAHLRGVLQLYDEGPRDVPILRTVATRGQGVAEVLACVERLFESGTGSSDERREARVRRRLDALVRDRLVEQLRDRPGAGERFERAVRRVCRREDDPYAASAALVAAAADPHDAPRMDHLGIAVPDLAAALSFWRDALGLTVAHEEDVLTEGVRVAMLPAGEARVELLEPLPGDGAVRSFLAKRGPGIHHACLEVRDIEQALRRLAEHGAQVVGEAPRRGAGGKLVAFVHPRSTGGVLLELSQPAPAEPA